MNHSQIAGHLEAIIREAADILYRNAGQSKEIETKSRNSLVTKIDKEIEAFLVDRLGKLIPESGFVAEEGTSTKKGAVYNWIIDPLDGTTNFIHGIPAFCISVALAEKEDIVVGVVYEFNSKEYFEAIRGSGAKLNGKTITVSPTPKLQDGLLATGFPYYDFEHMDAYLWILKDFMSTCRGIRRLGSAALDLAYVACGRFEGFFEYSLHPWDVAAGSLLVTEAGGKVTDFKRGSNFLYGKEIIASNGNLHEDLAGIIGRRFLNPDL